MSTTTYTPDDADQALKAKHRAMWALGDYHAVATEIIADLGPVLVDATGIGTGQHVLDVAAGSGNVAIPAAATGAHVIASDLTPELLDQGRVDAEARGVGLTWEVADVEYLPFDDGAFDVVTSCVGIMFAPHHQQAADQLIRVCRPGRQDRADRVDPGGVHRAAVRDHEAVQPAAPARRTASAAVGRPGPCARAAR